MTFNLHYCTKWNGLVVFSNRRIFKCFCPTGGKAGKPLYFWSCSLADTEQIVQNLETVCFNLRFKYDYKSITGNKDILIPIFRAFYCYSISITSLLHSHCPTLSLTRASEGSRTRIILLYDLTQKANNCLFPLLTTCPSAIQIRQVTCKVHLTDS